MQEGNKLKMDKAQLDFVKKLAEMEQRHREEIANIKQNTTEIEFEAEMEKRLIKHKAEIQSMLDKQAARMQKQAA